MRIKLILLSISMLLAISSDAAAQAPSATHETILVPIVVPAGEDVSGAYGSQWRGEVWMRVGTDVALGSDLQLGRRCPTCSYQPGSIQKLDLLTWQSAALLIVRRDVGNDLSFNARLFELSRRSQPQGVEVPIVRERDLLQEPVDLLGIPISHESRASIRIFDPFPFLQGSLFDVQVFGDSGLLATTTLKTEFDPALVGPPGGLGQLWTPAFAILPDLRAAFPQIAGQNVVHVRVVPHERNFPPYPTMYWTMASVTDNETQHVLLVTPQCCSPALEWP